MDATPVTMTMVITREKIESTAPDQATSLRLRRSPGESARDRDRHRTVWWFQTHGKKHTKINLVWADAAVLSEQGASVHAPGRSSEDVGCGLELVRNESCSRHRRLNR